MCIISISDEKKLPPPKDGQQLCRFTKMRPAGLIAIIVILFNVHKTQCTSNVHKTKKKTLGIH